MTTKPGDFDGDGTADVLRAYKLGSDWHLRVELANGAGGSDLVVTMISPATGMRAVGGFNLGGNAGDEAFAVVGGGGSTTIVGIFAMKGCTLVPMTEKGDPVGFSVGASVRNISGALCVLGTAFQRIEGTSPPTGTPFTVTRSNYDVVGTTLVFANSSQSTIAAGDPALAGTSGFNCGTLKL